MRTTNERQRYIVTSSLIGWAHTHNGPCTVPLPHFMENPSDLNFPLLLSCTICLTNNRIAGDSTHHSALYDLTLMVYLRDRLGRYSAVTL